MTVDVVALCRTRPDAESQAEALAAAGPELYAAAWQQTPVVVLLDDAGQIVLSFDGARLVSVVGEVRRLLGPSAPAVAEPVWWVEVRASAAVLGAPDAARRLATVLTDRHGGVVWPAEAAR